jgi:hypothetical protein
MVLSTWNQTMKPLNIEKLTLPLSAIQAMGSAQRSALLLLGLFLNEVNWLRKLLARSVSAPSRDEPEGQANFALTVLLAGKLRTHLTESDTTIYMTPHAYIGDILSQISTLAGIEPLLALNPNSDYRSLESVWKEVLDVTQMYAEFVASAMVAVITSCIPTHSAETITIADAPELQDDAMLFFVHPPSNLEELRRDVMSNAGKG